MQEFAGVVEAWKAAEIAPSKVGTFKAKWVHSFQALLQMPYLRVYKRYLFQRVKPVASR